MSYGVRLIWDLIKSGQLLIEQKSCGIESPILKEDIYEYGAQNPIRSATSHDIRFISGSAEAQREDPFLQGGDESEASQLS